MRRLFAGIFQESRSPDEFMVAARTLRRAGRTEVALPWLTWAVDGLDWDTVHGDAWHIACSTLASFLSTSEDRRPLRSLYDSTVRLDAGSRLLPWALRCLSVAIGHTGSLNAPENRAIGADDREEILVNAHRRLEPSAGN